MAKLDHGSSILRQEKLESATLVFLFTHRHTRRHIVRDIKGRPTRVARIDGRIDLDDGQTPWAVPEAFCSCFLIAFIDAPVSTVLLTEEK